MATVGRDNHLPFATKGNSEPDTGIVGWSIRTVIVNQLGLILPQCPITARYNVIPAGYEKQIRTELSRGIFGDHADVPLRT